MDKHLDTIRCKHCDAVIALLPVRSVKGRIAIDCPHCTTVCIIRPPQERLDIVRPPAYTEAVPA